MDNNHKIKNLLDKLLNNVSNDGVGVATVSDGRIVIFTRDKLKELYDMVVEENRDHISILIRNESALN